MKKAFVCGEHGETVDYSGDAVSGLYIAIGGGDEIDIPADRITEILHSFRSWNPLIEGDSEVPGGGQVCRLDRWIRDESLLRLGRAVTLNELHKVLGVFAGEGLIPLEFQDDGRVWCGLPAPDKGAALRACVGQVCLYHERGQFARVVLQAVRGEGEYIELALEPVPAARMPRGSAEAFTVGGSEDSISLSAGVVACAWVSWFLVTNPELVEKFTAFHQS